MKPKRQRMNEIHILAAELYGYSYNNYENHLAVDNMRFTTYMPEGVRILQRAEIEHWPQERIAEELELSAEEVEVMVEDFRKAKEIVFSQNASESFRNAVRDSIQTAMKNGLNTADDVEELVIQICFRASDLGYLLDREGKRLSHYGQWLQREKGVDYSGVGLPNLD
jgi:hypothetical protein